MNRARTVHLLGYSLFPRSTVPESELPWLVPGLCIYYHRSTRERVPATIVAVLRTVHAELRMVCQQGLQGAEIRALGPVTSIRLKIRVFQACQQGPRGAEIRTLGVVLWGPFNGVKFGEQPKNIEAYTHRAHSYWIRPGSDRERPLVGIAQWSPACRHRVGSHEMRVATVTQCVSKTEVARGGPLALTARR